MTKVECHNCNYEWDYSGDLQLATCPSCNLKTGVTNNES